MNKLDKMLTSGATQLEIAAALPYRSWQAIRRRIILLRGPGFVIPESGHLEDGETYEAYLSREPSVAGTMAFRAEGSLERQARCYRERHRSGGYVHPRFNVPALLIRSTFTLGIAYPASLPNHGDNPLLQGLSNIGPPTKMNYTRNKLRGMYPPFDSALSVWLIMSMIRFKRTSKGKRFSPVFDKKDRVLTSIEYLGSYPIFHN